MLNEIPPAVPATNKPKNKRAEPFPWTTYPDCDLLLLKAVETHGPHFCKGEKGIDGKWMLTKDTFLRALPEDLRRFDSDRFQKVIQNRFESLLESGEKFMESGNTSTQGGDLSKVMKRIQNIIDMIAQKAEEKNIKKGDQKVIAEKMTNNVDAALRTKRTSVHGHGRRKDLVTGEIIDDDGSISTASTNTNRQKGSGGGSSLDDAAFLLIKQITEEKEEKKRKESSTTSNWDNESNMEKLITVYLSGFTVIDLKFDHLKLITDESKDLLFEEDSKENLMVFLNIYCAQNKKFDQDHFVSKAKDCGLKGFDIFKLFRFLDKCRCAVEDQEKKRKSIEPSVVTTTPISAITTSSASGETSSRGIAFTENPRNYDHTEYDDNFDDIFEHDDDRNNMGDDEDDEEDGEKCQETNGGEDAVQLVAERGINNDNVGEELTTEDVAVVDVHQSSTATVGLLEDIQEEEEVERVQNTNGEQQQEERSKKRKQHPAATATDQALLVERVTATATQRTSRVGGGRTVRPPSKDPYEAAYSERREEARSMILAITQSSSCGGGGKTK